MKTFLRTGMFFACVLLTGCAGNHTVTYPDVKAPLVPPSANALLRVGDKITVQITGTPDGGSIVEKQIPASGAIDLQYLSTPIKAAGLNPADLAVQITQAYLTQKIYKTLVVNVLPEVQYITVGGDVRGPTNLPYRPDLTMIGVINACGGFTEFANRRSVRIIRGNQVIYVDCNKAISDPGADPPVYPGDQIFVPRTPF